MVGLQDIILAIIAYLIGSIPTSIWIGKRFYKVDVREHGSGNSGATNSLRVLGKKAGVIVLFIDILKGWLAVAILVFFSSYPSGSAQRIHLEVALASAAILGHIFPIYVGFKGGKGVATGLGIILAFSPAVALSCTLVFVIVFLIFHYVSVASMTAALSFPIWMAVMSNWQYKWVVAFSIFLPLLIVFMHRKNIMRLLKHQESKIQLFKKS